MMCCFMERLWMISSSSIFFYPFWTFSRRQAQHPQPGGRYDSEAAIMGCTLCKEEQLDFTGPGESSKREVCRVNKHSRPAAL